MDFVLLLPVIYWHAVAFVLGTFVGSFLNVLIARLPYEKSVIWPGSRCGACLRSLRISDNVPILGYLRLRGRCRFCGVQFSSRYLWVELATGVIFAGLLFLETMLNWHGVAGMNSAASALRNGWPSAETIGMFVTHATLISLLLAAAVIDAEHRVIPPQITYVGTVIGLIAATLMPWPWPTVTAGPTGPWYAPDAVIPFGVMPWPFWGPPPTWAAAGSGQLGLLNGLIGAAAGTALVRVFKFLFEVGFGQEALGLGDADLMMMAGAFFGWQVMLIGFFAGAMVGLALKVPSLVWAAITGTGAGRELSFGPGLAGGVVLTWLLWPWIGESARMLFEPVVLFVVAGVVSGGLLVSGMILRR